MVYKFIRRTVADFAVRMKRSCFLAMCKSVNAAYVHEKKGNLRLEELFLRRAEKQRASYYKWLAIRDRYQVKEDDHDRPEK